MPKMADTQHEFAVSVPTPEKAQRSAPIRRKYFLMQIQVPISNYQSIVVSYSPKLNAANTGSVQPPLGNQAMVACSAWRCIGQISDRMPTNCLHANHKEC